MTDGTRLLAIIRYPLTAQSTRTLAHATVLARASEPAALTVLHVNLLQNRDHAEPNEIARAIEPILSDVDPTVTVRRGFLIEEVISDEAKRTDADIIVLGKDNRSRWRQFLSRVIGNDPRIVPFLREHTGAKVEVIE